MPAVNSTDYFTHAGSTFQVISVQPGAAEVDPGKLRHRITVLRDAITRAADGSEIRTPENVATFWAKAEPVSGREFWAQQQVQSEVSWRFTISERGDGGRYTVLMCKEHRA